MSALSPSQEVPSDASLKPVKQEQVNPPTVLVHPWVQGLFPEHSSMSGLEKNKPKVMIGMNLNPITSYNILFNVSGKKKAECCLYKPISYWIHTAESCLYKFFSSRITAAEQCRELISLNILAYGLQRLIVASTNNLALGLQRLNFASRNTSAFRLKRLNISSK